MRFLRPTLAFNLYVCKAVRIFKMPLYIYMHLLTILSSVLSFTRIIGARLLAEKITFNCICLNIMRTRISTSTYYKQVDTEGLLVSFETIVLAFELLLGADATSGEVIELLPGD